jgi:hypothetical protein
MRYGTNMKTSRRISGKDPLPIDLTLIGLRKQRPKCLAERIDLESKGAIPRESKPASEDIERLALLLLDGPQSTAAASHDPDVRLFEVIQQIKAIDRAITIGEFRALVEHGQRSREIVAERKTEWLEIHRRRAVSIIALMTSNREIEDMQREMASGGQFAGAELTGFTGRLFGVGADAANVHGHFAIQYLKAAAKIGLIGEKDFRDV